MASLTSESYDEPATHCIHGSLTGPLGIFIQLLLASISFSALILKRFCEPIKTRRPWKIWLLDTSKQLIGAAVMHFCNVFISEFLFNGDPCTWYIITFLLDSTIGLLIIIILLKLSLYFIIKFNLKMLVYGVYSLPYPYTCWLYQCSIYVAIISIEKFFITLLTLIKYWKTVALEMLNLTSNVIIELIIVMFIIPIIVNAIIFWIVDNFLKLHHGEKEYNNNNNNNKNNNNHNNIIYNNNHKNNDNYEIFINEENEEENEIYNGLSVNK